MRLAVCLKTSQDFFVVEQRSSEPGFEWTTLRRALSIAAVLLSGVEEKARCACAAGVLEN